MTTLNENSQSSLTEGSSDPFASFIRDGIVKGATSVEIKREDPRELESRLRKQELEAKFERWKDIGLSAVIIFVSIAIIVFCCYLVYNPNVSQDNKDHAWHAITLIAGAYLGYLGGRVVK